MRRGGHAARASWSVATSAGSQAVGSTPVAPQAPFGPLPHRAASSLCHTWHQAGCSSPRVDGHTSHCRGFAAQAAAVAPGGVRQHKDPFTLVSDELDAVSARMRAAVVSEVRCAWFYIALSAAWRATGSLEHRAPHTLFFRFSATRACVICDPAVLLDLPRCRRWRRRRSISSRKELLGSAYDPQCCCSSPPPWTRTARREHTCAR